MKKLRKHRVGARILALLLPFSLLLGGVATPSWAAVADAQPAYLPPLFEPYELASLGGLSEMLPSPAPNLPDPQGAVSRLPGPDLSALNRSDEDPGYVDPVTGIMSLDLVDLTYPSVGFDLAVTRSYLRQEGLKGLLGYGWNLAYDQHLQMYQDFEIMEFRSDGNHRSYYFTKDDPDLIVDFFDGDPLTYYPLDQGTFTEIRSRATMTRNADGTYTVTENDRFTYLYNGYKAPWRRQAPDAGKLISITDPSGNTIKLTYDQTGELSQITDTAGRTITVEVRDGLARKIIGPGGPGDRL